MIVKTLRSLFCLSGLFFVACGYSSSSLSENNPKNADLSGYEVWLGQGDHAERVAEFEQALQTQDVFEVVPTYQILRTAMDWKKCDASPFELPDRKYWGGAFASLSALKTDIIPDVGEIEIVSGYRNPKLNKCAGGSKGSVHMQFGAFDAYARDISSNAKLNERLCKWHGTKGKSLRAGLGLYGKKKFHIDVGLKSYRRWGPDYTRKSSPCGK